MTYQVVVAPELGLGAEELAAAWNRSPECRELAEARLGDQGAQSYGLDPAWVQQGVVLLVGAAGGLALESVREVVKEKLTAFLRERLKREPKVQVEAVRQPGGGYLLVVGEGGEA